MTAMIDVAPARSGDVVATASLPEPFIERPCLSPSAKRCTVTECFNQDDEAAQRRCLLC